MRQSLKRGENERRTEWREKDEGNEIRLASNMSANFTVLDSKLYEMGRGADRVDLFCQHFSSESSSKPA